MLNLPIEVYLATAALLWFVIVALAGVVHQRVSLPMGAAAAAVAMLWPAMVVVGLSVIAGWTLYALLTAPPQRAYYATATEAAA